jgi:hypothetical protein
MSKIINQIINSSVIGLTTTSSIILGSMVSGLDERNDWRDVVCWGIIGLALSSRYLHTGRGLWY